MLGEITLKTTLQGWMSNVIQWTGVNIQRFFLILLGLIPILIQVYFASLLNFYLVYLAIVWWIFLCLWGHIQHKYFAHIHPPLKWIIKLIFKSIFQTTYLILVFVLYFASSDGFFNWGFVKLHECTLHLSSSMEVRNCNAHLDMIIKFDNYTSSQTQFVKVCDEFGIISVDRYKLTAVSNRNITDYVVKDFWLTINKMMMNAKADVYQHENRLQGGIVSITKWNPDLPELEFFGIIMIYGPYLIGILRFRLVTDVFIFLCITQYFWFLYMRYLCSDEYGLFSAIFHWNTFCNGIYISCFYFLWNRLMSWIHNWGDWWGDWWGRARDESRRMARDISPVRSARDISPARSARATSPPRDASIRRARDHSPPRPARATRSNTRNNS
jgi:hypothetical protein